jgi:two-component system sensor histidine kinase/response regulator
MICSNIVYTDLRDCYHQGAREEGGGMARVLLIDDDDMLRDVYAEMLDATGHQAMRAGTGATGIEMIRSTRPDLVICDVNMPGMDGYAVLDAVRADPQIASTPFLFLTGLDARHHFRAAMSLGADDYLSKPVRQEDLVAAVEARLARRAAERRDSERRVAELQRSVTFLLPHELRTPLTVILGGSEMLRDLHQEMTPQEIGEMATTISKAAQRLHRMVENYLVHVGMELERLSVADSPARALSGAVSADLVRDVAFAQAREYGRDQDLQVVLADAKLPLAEPYARKVVSELVDNALKFSEAGQPIKVSFTTTAQDVTLAVADAGRGMTPEQIREVGAFRQFNRAVFEQQGSGLGLTLVRGIIEASGGAFDLRSGAGGGTTVSATWPA